MSKLPSTPMKWVYFVSYSWWNYTTVEKGQGRCDVIRDYPINTIEDIEAVEQAIKDDHAKTGVNSDVVCVLNYQFMRSEVPVQPVAEKEAVE